MVCYKEDEKEEERKRESMVGCVLHALIAVGAVGSRLLLCFS